jgi:hypothetical protein
LDSQLLLQLETQHLELQSLQEQPLVHLVVECLVLPPLLLHQGEAFLDNKIPVPVVEAFLDLHSHNKQALDSQQQVLVCADSLFIQCIISLFIHYKCCHLVTVVMEMFFYMYVKRNNNDSSLPLARQPLQQ